MFSNSSPTPPIMRKQIAQIWQLAEPYVQDAGLDLVEVEFGQEHEGQVLRVFIDYPDGPAANDAGDNAAVVGLDECERVSHELSAALSLDTLFGNSGESSDTWTW